MAKLHSASPREITSPFTHEIISVLHSKACNNLYIFHSYSCNWRASAASETPSIATYREKNVWAQVHQNHNAHAHNFT